MTATLTKVYRTDKDKNGNPLMSKAGKPYTRMSIKCQEHGDKWLSGFSSGWNQNWKEGDTVEIEVKQNGQYLNFEKSDPVVGLSLDVAGLKIRMAKLEAAVEDMNRSKSHERIENPFTNDPQPEEIDAADIPF